MKQARKTRNSAFIGILLIILLICAAASVAVLFARLSLFNTEGFQNIIPLTEQRGNTVLTVSSAGEPAKAPSGQTVTTSAQSAAPSQTTPIPSGANPSFTAYDENTVWSTETNVEIFKLSYDETGKLTVMTADGDKLLAPGTSNSYTFTLENTGNVPLDYTMSMEAWFGTEYAIPVTASVHDYNGSYLLGSAADKKDVLDLNSVSESGVLGSGRCAVYTLDWEWVFERGEDELDTMLGNLAVDEDITLTIRIMTTAQCDFDTDVGDSGIKPPQTGDNTPMPYILLFIAAVALIAFARLFLLFRRKDDDDEQKDELP